MELLTIQQAAARLGATPRFMRRLVAERRIAYVKVGRFVRFTIEDIDAFVSAGRIEPAGH